MLRSAPVVPALLLSLALPAVSGCEQLFLDELAPEEPAALRLPVVRRTQRAAADEVKAGPPDLTSMTRDPFLTAEEDETRRRQNMPKAEVAVATSQPRVQRAASAAAASKIEIIRRDLSARVPLIIVGENGRNIAILSDGSLLEEGEIIEGYYVVQKIESDGIRIGSTDGKYRTRLPFAQSAREGDWDLKGAE